MTTTTSSTTAATSSSMAALTANASKDAAAAAQKAAIQKLKTSMGAGSGVDVASLAQNLVDAERIPKENTINKNITTNESRISGYGAISFMVSNLKDALNALKNKSSFNAISVENSNTSAFNVTAGATAPEGNFDITVSSLSKSQKSMSAGFLDSATALNGGSAFDLALTGSNIGVTVGIPNGTDPNTLDGVAFGTNPASNDFKTFSLNIDGSPVTLTPSPSTQDLKGLAADLQSQLRKLSNGTDLIVTTSGTSLSFSSASKSISNPTLSQSAKISLDPGARIGSTNTLTSTISNIAFGTIPNTTDFKSFEMTVAGKKIVVTPSPATADLTGLAADLQKQIRSSDGSSDVSVNLDGTGTGLVFTSATSRAIGYPFLTANTFPDTPTGVVNAINNANRGVKAELVNDGSSLPYKIVLTGASGASQAFSVTSTNGLSFSTVPGYTATDAVVSVNGVTYTRNNNNIKDVIPGVTLDLKATNTSLNGNGVNVAAPASLVLARDNTAIETKVDAIVTAYNDLNDILTQVGDPKSTLQTYGGTLVADSTVSLIRNQVRKMMLGVSSTAGTNVGALWQMGLSIDQKGVLSKDATKFSAALTNNYADVVKTFTGNQENQSIYSPVAAGLAGDGVKSLTKMLSATGPIVTRSDGATKENTKYTSQLATLKTRMDALLTRYTKQFSTMDSLVGNINSMKASLTSTFNAMNNTNTK